MNYSTDFRSIRDDVSAQEWQTRIDLAACYRLVDHYGMSDLRCSVTCEASIFPHSATDETARLHVHQRPT